MKISQTGLELIKKFEGCRLTSYQDSGGVWTIGYGHTKGVTAGMTITQAQADSFLVEDCGRAEAVVNKYQGKYNFNQNQFDALVSFAFNIGSIDKLTVNGTRTIVEISKKIPAYCNCAGKKLRGLVNRREAEKKLFDTPVNGQAISLETPQTTVHAHSVGEVVTVSSYYVSSTDSIEKAIIKTQADLTISKVLDTDVHNPYRLDRNGVAIGWCNDGDIRSIGSVQAMVSQTAEKVDTTGNYVVGKIYTLQANMKVRTSAGTNFRAKTYDELTPGGKKVDVNKDGVLEKGTRVTCQEVKRVGNDIWIRIPSGWIAAVYSGKIYVK